MWTRKTKALREKKNASNKVKAFKKALKEALVEHNEENAKRKDAQEAQATQNNIKASALATRIPDHESELGFDSRGLVGVLKFNSKSLIETDRKNPGNDIAKDKIKAFKEDRKYWQGLADGTENKDDKDFFNAIADLDDQRADEIRIGIGEEPVTEEGQAALRDSNAIISRYRRFKEWAKKNLAGLSAIAVSVAGIITTVVLSGRSALRTGAQAVSGFAKAVANVGKKLWPILGTVLSIIGTILSMGAKGLGFLSRNLWILAVVLAYFLYDRYRRSGRRRRS